MYDLAHICIVVKDIEEAYLFYRDVLKCEDAGRCEANGIKFCYLNSNGQVIELLQYINREYKKRDRGPIDHLAFKVYNLDEEIKRLKNIGIKMLLEKPKDVLNKRIMFFEGPNGERIEFIEEKRD